jgi:Tol biopolymer transport system component
VAATDDAPPSNAASAADVPAVAAGGPSTNEGSTPAPAAAPPAAPAPAAPPAAPPVVPACDPAKAFAAPALLAGFPADVQAGTPRLSPDELEIYFTTRTAAGGAELGMAKRASRGETFGPIVALAAQNTLANDNNPSVSPDGLTLFFHSDRSGNNDLFFATRATKNVAFGAPTAITSLNTAGAESQISYRAGGDEAWFVSPKAGTWDIYVAKRKAGDGFVFDTPVVVTELSSASDDWAPWISEDGLTFTFISNRAGSFDLYMAKRASTALPFGAPAALTTLNSPTTDYGGWVSQDGCRIYFSSVRDTPGEGLQRIWYSERPK